MSFLKKLGQVALQIIGIAGGFMPLVKATIPQAGSVIDKLGQAFNVVITVEQAAVASGAGLTGSQKLAAATPFVAQIIQQVDLLSGKKPKDEEKFKAAATALTSAMADILNSFGE